VTEETVETCCDSVDGTMIDCAECGTQVFDFRESLTTQPVFSVG
jgi:hypothetical protein